ncbi:MAG TPA: lamin tail domain-containing protein [Anditalea sp.]|nr:lamin tail domain-containing protein [Anditalea sp.]
MRTFVYVWVWFAFSILGFTFLPKAETFAVTQNIKSNFLITLSSEINGRLCPAYSAGFPSNHIYLANKIGLLSPKVLGLSQIATYNPEIYRKTSTERESLSRICFQAKTERNGSYIDLPIEELECLQEGFYVENVEIISQNIIRITFSDYPDPATIIFPDRYSISGLPPYDVVLLDNLYQVDLYLAQSLTIGDSINLHLKNIRSIAGIDLADVNIQMIYNDGIIGVFAKDKTTIQILLDEEVSLEELDHSSFRIQEEDFTFEILSSSKSNLLEIKVIPGLEEGLHYNLIIPTRKSLKDKIISGSIRNFILDTTPPQPVHLRKLENNKILVHFDEAIDPVMAVVPQHYSLNGQIPIEVSLLENPKQVLLVIDEPVNLEEKYELRIINIEDLYGNALSIPAQISSNLNSVNEPGNNNVVINEVMAAPRAGLILPNSEYVELLNVSENEINIGGYRLHNSRRSTAIPAGTVISPGEYILLCPNARRALLEPFGRVIGLPSWPTLLNNADIVVLYDREGAVVDSLGYTRSNYGSTQIAQGGYSLEVVNPYSQCNLLSNLRPSTDPSRGTPGAINSVFDDTPDRTPAVLTGVSTVNDQQIIAIFSKPISQDFAYANWSLSPEMNIISTEFYNGTQTEIQLLLENPLIEDIRYTLQVTNIRDCSGNLISPDGSTFTFALPMAAEAGDIVINEILFNPHTGTPKFVEIYNTSEKFINLKNWKLGNESGGLISNRRVISGNDLVISPRSYRAITTDAAMLIQMYPKAINLVDIGTLPSYPIREGTVFLLNPEEDLIERLDYHENFHHPLLRIPRGVSLERINPYSMPNEPQNWTSASGAVGNATPGFKNSQQFSVETINSGITVSPEVFAPETAGAQNYTTIQYQMDDPGYIGTIKIFDISGKLIKEIVQNEIWGYSGFYLWNGTDLNGNKVKVGYYIIWVELLNLEGKVINIKKTVAVGTKIR